MAIRLATGSRLGSLVLVNKLHAGNIIQQSSLDSISNATCRAMH
ncbi:hypothetical protein [Leptospira kirschneri]|nr:hypothetical protein [Leptospira kirschneri]